MRYFIRYIKNGMDCGVDVTEHELSSYLINFIRAGYIVTGVETYK